MQHCTKDLKLVSAYCAAIANGKLRMGFHPFC